MATTDRLELSYFRVNIGALTTGHIDNKSVEEYMADDTPTTPADKNTSLEKEYANMRYKRMLELVSDRISPIYVIDIVRSSNDVNDTLTEFDFTLVYDRADYLVTKTLTGEPESVGTELSGADAIKRWIERALNSTVVENRQIYDPTQDAGAVRNGPQYVSLTALPAETSYPVAAVTVAEIDFTLPTV